MQRFQGQKAKIPFFAGRLNFKNGYFDAGFAFAWGYVHLKFERKRCFWCRVAPEPVFTKIGLRNIFQETQAVNVQLQVCGASIRSARSKLLQPTVAPRRTRLRQTPAPSATRRSQIKGTPTTPKKATARRVASSGVDASCVVDRPGEALPELDAELVEGVHAVLPCAAVRCS